LSKYEHIQHLFHTRTAIKFKDAQVKNCLRIAATSYHYDIYIGSLKIYVLSSYLKNYIHHSLSLCLDVRALQPCGCCLQTPLCELSSPDKHHLT